MEKKILKELDAELAHAGEQTQLSPQTLMLEQLRITSQTELRPMEFLFRLFDKPCFPRKELVAITGKAKSGKTFVTSMLMAAGIAADAAPQTEADSCFLLLQRMAKEPLRVLWYDTEQSDESTQDILKNRLLALTASSDAEQRIDVFNVRAAEWKQRRALLMEAVVHTKPDLVVVDGIRDLVNDINDGVLAQEVMEELMHLATANNCCIVCVLHQNKGSEDNNLRGWIGTELMNKAFEVYACEKLLPQRVFKMEQTLTRKYDIEQTLYFEVGADGLPRRSASTDDATPATARREGDRLPQLNQQYIVHDGNGGDDWHFDVVRLFLDALHGREEIGGAELREEVMRLSGVCSYKFYNHLLAQAVEQKVIVKSIREGRVIYRAAPF